MEKNSAIREWRHFAKQWDNYETRGNKNTNNTGVNWKI